MTDPQQGAAALFVSKKRKRQIEFPNLPFPASDRIGGDKHAPALRAVWNPPLTSGRTVRMGTEILTALNRIAGAIPERWMAKIRITLSEIFVATFCVAAGITCLKLSVSPRFGWASVPNGYLVLAGLSFLASIPFLCLIHRPEKSILMSWFLALCIAVPLMFATLAWSLLSGAI